MTLTSVTPLLLTYNEEANIDRTLGRLIWAERVVVVDSYSTDATVDIATSYDHVYFVQGEFDEPTGRMTGIALHLGAPMLNHHWLLSISTKSSGRA